MEFEWVLCPHFFEWIHQTFLSAVGTDLCYTGGLERVDGEGALSSSDYCEYAGELFQLLITVQL